MREKTMKEKIIKIDYITYCLEKDIKNCVDMPAKMILMSQVSELKEYVKELEIQIDEYRKRFPDMDY